jgi:hypothetical protein
VRTDDAANLALSMGMTDLQFVALELALVFGVSRTLPPAIAWALRLRR